jgi:autotransporter-associated beta strand protein
MTNSTWSVETNRTATVGSTLSGSTGLTKNDGGTLMLTGSNNYTGGTLVSGGTLALNGGSVVGNITNNANVSITADLVNVVSGTGSLTKTGAGDAILWSAMGYTGARGGLSG